MIYEDMLIHEDECKHLSTAPVRTPVCILILTHSGSPKLMLEASDLSAQRANEVHVFRYMMVDVEGVSRSVSLDVLGAVGILECVESFLE